MVGKEPPEGATTNKSREAANLSKQYFIRIRGIVRGPFPAEKLKDLARRGQFSRVHHVSVDGINWEPAANHPELLPEAKAVRIHKQPIKAEEKDSGYELAATGEPAAVDGSRNEPAREDDPRDRAAWYYASGGNQVGPISFAELRQLASRGALQHNDPVWGQGMSAWTEAASVSGLFAKENVNINCPCCKNLLKVADDAFGKTVLCPICQQPIAIPSASESSSAGQRPEPSFPTVASQDRRQPVEKNGTKIAAAVAGGALGLLFLVAIAGWLFTKWEPIAPDAAPEVGCAACGTVMTLLVFCSTAIVVLNIALLVWVARDAKARGMDSAVVWMLLVMFTSLLGLLIYLFSRPQGNVLPCPTCGNKRLQASARCPHCGNA